MVRIGSARIDESGKLIGGQAGDQTGQEVAVEAWYRHDKGWVVIRAKDAAVRERIAQCMEAACTNNNIGYDQSTSWDLYDKAKQYGWDCSKVNTPVETDCSSLVRVCVAFAIGKDVPWFSTANQVLVLDATKLFDVITDTSVTNHDTALKRGDILCTRTQGHTVVALDNGSAVSGSTSKPSEGNTSFCGKGIGTAVAKTAMHIRDGAKASANSLAIIQKGTAVEVLEVTADFWYKIVWPGASCGYAYTKGGEVYYDYTAIKSTAINVGDTVYFSGGAQYISAWATTPVAAKAGHAKVTQLCATGKHNYHIVGDGVYGWVDGNMLKKE